ncbi:MAG: inositol monophosphatase family protein [Bacteroidota bacterium]
MKSQILKVAIDAALEAGKIQKSKSGKPKNIEKKFGQETNLVTEVDKLCEKKIISIIRDTYPSHDILTEESGALKKISPYRWIIDPIDGTTNFAHGLPLFCVSIGIEFEKEIIAGVIFNPMTDELFYAERGKGAFLNSKQIFVSKTKKLIDSLVVTGFPYNIKENPGRVIEHFVNFLPRARGVRRLGSAAIDFAYVAAGRFDGYWEVFLNPWDKSAGILLVEEAGGKVTNFKNERANSFQQSSLATNGLVHDEMIKVLKKKLK